ncbi:hypothetical protein WJX74_001560 [Apatococcus lobatus]|uniref:TLC domain-containing protein n=1 Tax=Apatococcus lobatus TaxID=904363 RepID=A0AAW1QUM1_9CHLO
MATAEYPMQLLHTIAGTSFIAWFVLPFIVHAVAARAWPAYTHLPHRVKSGFCNRIVSAAHAILLVAVQFQNLQDPSLWEKPLTAVTDAHFFWGSIMLGYLAYDTLHLLMTWKDSGRYSFLVHHLTAMASVALGIYGKRLAVFGMATQVAFELTTPLLHTLGCMKVAGQHRTKLYVILSAIFFLMFLVCRVAIAIGIFCWMLVSISSLPTPTPHWAWAGLSLYAVLCGVNLHWFLMLCSMAKKLVQPERTASTALKELTAIQGKGELVRSFSGPMAQSLKAPDPSKSRLGSVSASMELHEHSLKDLHIRARHAHEA